MSVFLSAYPVSNSIGIRVSFPAGKGCIEAYLHLPIYHRDMHRDNVTSPRHLDCLIKCRFIHVTEPVCYKDNQDPSLTSRWGYHKHVIHTYKFKSVTNPLVRFNDFHVYPTLQASYNYTAPTTSFISLFCSTQLWNRHRCRRRLS